MEGTTFHNGMKLGYICSANTVAAGDSSDMEHDFICELGPGLEMIVVNNVSRVLRRKSALSWMSVLSQYSSSSPSMSDPARFRKLSTQLEMYITMFSSPKTLRRISRLISLSPTVFLTALASICGSSLMPGEFLTLVLRHLAAASLMYFNIFVCSNASEHWYVSVTESVTGYGVGVSLLWAVSSCCG